MYISQEKEPKGNKIRKQWTDAVGRGQGTYTPTQAVIEKARGCVLHTADGRRLLDFTSGVLVQNLGYNHPVFEKRFAQYRKNLPRNAYNMITPVQAEASSRLIKSMKSNPKAEKMLWAASGSEGIQKAMWAAMHRYPDRPILVATRFGFHGKKGLAADVTGETSKNPNVRFVSFPMYTPESPDFYKKELDALYREFPGKIALFITEPYLGAKGSFHPPAWYHQLVQAWCNKHDIPFLFDEVQSCFGRTGNMYAYETYGVTPDMVILGKGLASGESAAAVVGRADLIDSLDYGEASDTYSASVAACSAVCATLDVFKEEQIVRKTKKMAQEVHAMLLDLQQTFPFIRDVRGEGMVYGLEIEGDSLANRCVLEAYRATDTRGVHFLGPLAGKVIRVSPPLVLSESELKSAHSLLLKAWKKI
ncbi:MAG TPA: aspartate aminotransferase family protein [Candidatus Hydrogenedentes bacterium]|jgi:4-aminobutyrate aminotransferase-like enzyme|nr:MAG: 2,2-dialkylglycine decarboxylase [Candidatus Hydrogenedentes bacterium ADurb.Bin170]HNZ48475.1 aspartate aminotransferase family protein [Candidatus Hydrogenedentota bacterium]HOD94996.1 aspartate aminotransferase family protein [Candidatus Hydrogenedentota bacterium]HOM47631.1 aspartate aminotransferase family protein [Candidatus Hydrogenedentota bacterium]HOR49739.1 aspartate aminotransferase family protein [Candidatus Hydrogenedentota bacterium]